MTTTVNLDENEKLEVHAYFITKEQPMYCIRTNDFRLTMTFEQVQQMVNKINAVTINWMTLGIEGGN